MSNISLLNDKREIHHEALERIKRQSISRFRKQHNIYIPELLRIIEGFSELRVVVIGDLILDEYIECETLGISQEDQHNVMSPIEKKLYIGGAGITASHAKGLGAKVKYFSVVGNDSCADSARVMLNQQGVEAFLLSDSSRPTTLKKRYTCQGNTVFRITELKSHEISIEQINYFVTNIRSALKEADLLVFSDYNYGCLPQEIVECISCYCLKENIPMVADSQSSSQMGDISRFQNMLLITPTEYEARLALQDKKVGLMNLSQKLRKASHAQHIIITLGENGVFINASCKKHLNPDVDELDAFNSRPKDISGAGDSLFITTAMALVSGADIWESAYLGSLAASCQVSRKGNVPLMPEELYRSF